MGGRESSNQPEDPGVLRPLHGGRHSIPADVLAHNQRERLLAALASCVAENGYNATTITQITAAASVSRRTFYEHFDGKEECFLAAYEALDGYLATVMEEAEAGEDEWPDKVAAAVAALISFLASRPNFARLYLLEVAVVGEAAAEAREKTTQRFIDLLEPGRRYRDVDPGIEEGLIGGIVTLLGRRVLNGEAAQLERFTPAGDRIRPRALPGSGRGAGGDRPPRRGALRGRVAVSLGPRGAGGASREQRPAKRRFQQHAELGAIEVLLLEPAQDRALDEEQPALDGGFELRGRARC